MGFGSCYRNEPSGALHGIMRVRGFTQDDAHIFATEKQIRQEASDFIKLTLDVYKDFGFDAVEMKLSTRPEGRIGDDAQWDLAEAALEDALNEAGLEWELQPGEGGKRKQKNHTKLPPNRNSRTRTKKKCSSEIAYKTKQK